MRWQDEWPLTLRCIQYAIEGENDARLSIQKKLITLTNEEILLDCGVPREELLQVEEWAREASENDTLRAAAIGDVMGEGEYSDTVDDFLNAVYVVIESA